MMAQVPEMPIFQAWVTHQIKADRLLDCRDRDRRRRWTRFITYSILEMPLGQGVSSTVMKSAVFYFCSLGLATFEEFEASDRADR